MVKTPDDLKNLAKVMREEGIGYFKAAPDGTVEVYLAPGAFVPPLTKQVDDDGEAAAAAAEGKEKKAPRTPYDDDDLWPGGRKPTLRRPGDRRPEDLLES